MSGNQFPINQREIPQALRMSPGDTGGSEAFCGTLRDPGLPGMDPQPISFPMNQVRVTVLPRITSLEGGFVLEEAYSRAAYKFVT